jgi:polyisoprenoid-binding protein YceI
MVILNQLSTIKKQNMETAAVKTKWSLDPVHSEITFKVKHLMISNVKGEFRKFNVDVQGEDWNTAKLKAVLDASSIHTNDEGRDTHLRGSDFFDVENNKEIVFTSTSFKKQDADNFELKGDLTIKGVTKPVKFDVEFGGTGKDPWGNEKAGFSLSGKLNRKDWGLTWNAALETGGMLVSDEVRVSAELQFVKS